MRIEDALTQLLATIKEREDKGDVLLINSLSYSQLENLIDADISIGLLRPVTTASYLARAPGSGCFTGTRKRLLDQIFTRSFHFIRRFVLRHIALFFSYLKF